jgi:hypothetical protein
VFLSKARRHCSFPQKGKAMGLVEIATLANGLFTTGSFFLMLWLVLRNRDKEKK